MRNLVIYALAHGLAYVFQVVLILGLIGIVNRLLHKPFFDCWQRYLGFVTAWVVGGWLFDLVPLNLHLIVAVTGGLILLASFIWVCIKYPSQPPKRGKPDTLPGQDAA